MKSCIALYTSNGYYTCTHNWVRWKDQDSNIRGNNFAKVKINAEHCLQILVKITIDRWIFVFFYILLSKSNTQKVLNVFKYCLVYTTHFFLVQLMNINLPYMSILQTILYWLFCAKISSPLTRCSWKHLCVCF